MTTKYELILGVATVAETPHKHKPGDFEKELKARRIEAFVKQVAIDEIVDKFIVARRLGCCDSTALIYLKEATKNGKFVKMKEGRRHLFRRIA